VSQPDRRLLELLSPIFLSHAHVIEAVLPPELRPNWRKAVAYACRSRGPKGLDHRSLLLAMAELDADGARPARELAAEVVAKFPRIPGAGLDEREHVQLPDGSRPARKDLLDRLARRYGEQRPTLTREVAETKRLVERALKRADRLVRKGVRVPPRNQGDKPSAAISAKLRALNDAGFTLRFTAEQFDAVRGAIRKATKKP
jgi:hypothetical protein